MLSRAFKSGNSLAIRIPKELAIVSPNQDVDQWGQTRLKKSPSDYEKPIEPDPTDSDTTLTI